MVDWNKEVKLSDLFGGKRKQARPAAPAPATTSNGTSTNGASKTSVLKRDVSLRRTRKPADARPPAAKRASPRRQRRVASHGVLGLKIGSSQLAAARVANENGELKLVQVAREPLERGVVVAGEVREPEVLAAALADFFTRHKLPRRGVRLGVATNRIGVRSLVISGIEDERQLANAIRFRAQETLPIPIDEAVLDYQVVSEGRAEDGSLSRRILLVVAYRDSIERYAEACARAKIELAGIDLEAFALLRALRSPAAANGSVPAESAHVAVALGYDRSTLAVSDGRVCEFTRVVDWGGSALDRAIAGALRILPVDAERLKRSLSLADSAAAAAIEGVSPDDVRHAQAAVQEELQNLARELVSSLQFYQSQPGSLAIGEIVLTGGTVNLEGLPAELAGLIGVPVRVGDPLARVTASAGAAERDDAASLAIAIGLGLED